MAFTLNQRQQRQQGTKCAVWLTDVLSQILDLHTDMSALNTHTRYRPTVTSASGQVIPASHHTFS
jgi:hypothetical protein